MARPKIEINADNFKKLCGLQCTLSEIAAFFDCSEDTVERWCKRELKMNFADVFKKHSSPGKISLRRWQFRAAEAGNCTMLIWLGKQYLGQKDTQEITVDRSADETIKKMEAYFNGQDNRGK